MRSLMMIIFSLIVFFNVKVSLFFFFDPLVSYFWILVFDLFFIIFYFFYLFVFLSFFLDYIFGCDLISYGLILLSL